MAPIKVNVRKLILHNWVYEKKNYRQLAQMFGCSKSGVAKIIKKFGENSVLHNLPRKVSRSGPANPKKEKKVLELLKQKKTLSVRQMARKAGVSIGTIQNIKKRNNIKTYKKQKIAKRSTAQQQRAKQRSRNLYNVLLKEKNRCILMDDETYVKMDLSTLAGPQFYHAMKGEVVPDEIKGISSEKFGKKIMVWQAICSCGKRSTPFFTSGTVNGKIYRDECIKKRLLPLYRKHTNPPLFWPDLATCHYSNDTVDLYKQKNIDFVLKDDNPPNCPSLRPIERYWAIMKRMLRNDGQDINSIEQFKKKWSATSKKITTKVVQNLMVGIRRKVRKFHRG